MTGRINNDSAKSILVDLPSVAANITIDHGVPAAGVKPGERYLIGFDLSDAGFLNGLVWCAVAIVTVENQLTIRIGNVSIAPLNATAAEMTYMQL